MVSVFGPIDDDESSELSEEDKAAAETLNFSLSILNATHSKATPGKGSRKR
jgi:hypothetical protein